MTDEEDTDWDAPAREALERSLKLGDEAPDGRAREAVELCAEFHNLYLGTEAPLVVPPVGEGLYDGGLIHTGVDLTEGLGLVVSTGMHSGQALCFQETLAGPPAAVESGWEEVTEVSLRVDNGPLLWGNGGAETGEEPIDTLGPGWYRVRMHAVNRELMAGDVCDLPVERYFAQAWRENGPRDGLVFREIAVSEYRRPVLVNDDAPRVLAVDPQWVEPPLWRAPFLDLG